MRSWPKRLQKHEASVKIVVELSLKERVETFRRKIWTLVVLYK